MDQYVQYIILFGVIAAALGAVWTVGADELSGGLDEQIYQIDILKDRASESLNFVHGGVVYPSRVLNMTYIMPDGSSGLSTLISDSTTVLDIANNGIGSTCISEIIVGGMEVKNYVILLQDKSSIGVTPIYHFNPISPILEPDGCYDRTDNGRYGSLSPQYKNNIGNNVLKYNTLTRVLLLGDSLTPPPPTTEHAFSPTTGTSSLMQGITCTQGDDIRVITTSGNIFVTKCAGGFD